MASHTIGATLIAYRQQTTNLEGFLNTARIVVVALSLSLSFCAAQQASEPYASARMSYDQAIELLNQGKWEQAATLLKRALDSDILFCEAHEKYQDVEYYYFERKDKVFTEYANLL